MKNNWPADIRFTTKEVSVKKIKLNPDNPRIVKDESFRKLVDSIKSFPAMLWLRPVVVNGDMMILGGDKRFKAAIEAGYEKVPVINAESLPESQQREFIIKDNVSTGEWNLDMLTKDWDIEQLQEWGMPDFDLQLGSDINPDTQAQESFADEGISPKDQYGVIVMCQDEQSQEAVYARLTSEGYKCKIVVT